MLNILTYYHLQDFSSGRELIQTLQEDDYARKFVAPASGIKHSTFFDTVDDRGVEQLLYVFTELQKQAAGVLPSQYSDLGEEDSHIFFDAKVLLGTLNINQTKEPVRLVGYIIEGKQYWVDTDRFDLSAEQVVLVHKLRWDVETFFAWWKRHLNVYHLFTRSQNGLMVQVLSGLITYPLLAIYCRQQHDESVSIRRVRELRNQIQNEAMQQAAKQPTAPKQKRRLKCRKQPKKPRAIF